MVKVSMKGFRAVEVKRGGFTIQSGGYLNKSMPLFTKDILPDAPACEFQGATYVRLSTREPWLNKAVMGTSSRGEMHPGVLKDLREKIVIAEQQIRHGLPVTIPAQDLTDDPMDEMFSTAMDEVTTVQTPKKKKAFVKQVCIIPMREWPEETDKSGTNALRDVSLHLEGKGAVWIHLKDLDWLLRTLFIQQQLKGVPGVASDDEGPDRPKKTQLNLNPQSDASPSMAPDLAPDTDVSDSMESDLTPEKRPRPQDEAVNLYSKWADAP